MMAFEQIPKRIGTAFLEQTHLQVSRPKTKVSKTHFNGKPFCFDSVLQGGKSGLCDQKYRTLYNEYIISKQESKVFEIIESFSNVIKRS